MEQAKDCDFDFKLLPRHVNSLDFGDDSDMIVDKFPKICFYKEDIKNMFEFTIEGPLVDDALDHAVMEINKIIKDRGFITYNQIKEMFKWESASQICFHPSMFDDVGWDEEMDLDWARPLDKPGRINIRIPAPKMLTPRNHSDEFNVVSNPKHYTEGRKYEPRKVISDWELNFNLGNAVKYISRTGRKVDAIEDLKKAIQYIQFEIEELEAKKKNG